MRYRRNSNSYTHIFEHARHNGTGSNLVRCRPTPGNGNGGDKPEVVITCTKVLQGARCTKVHQGARCTKVHQGAPRCTNVRCKVHPGARCTKVHCAPRCKVQQGAPRCTNVQDAPRCAKVHQGGSKQPVLLPQSHSQPSNTQTTLSRLAC